MVHFKALLSPDLSDYPEAKVYAKYENKFFDEKGKEIKTAVSGGRTFEVYRDKNKASAGKKFGFALLAIISFGLVFLSKSIRNALLHNTVYTKLGVPTDVQTDVQIDEAKKQEKPSLGEITLCSFFKDPKDYYILSPLEQGTKPTEALMRGRDETKNVEVLMICYKDSMGTLGTHQINASNEKENIISEANIEGPALSILLNRASIPYAEYQERIAKLIQNSEVTVNGNKITLAV